MKLFFSLILSVLFSINISAQEGNIKSDSFKVSGNCGMCKKRIEKAALTAGARTASWDAGSKLLSVSFDPSSTNSDDLAKKVAEAGHDAGQYKAANKTYNTLPGCCKYDRTGKADNSKPMDHKSHSHN